MLDPRSYFSPTVPPAPTPTRVRRRLPLAIERLASGCVVYRLLATEQGALGADGWRVAGNQAGKSRGLRGAAEGHYLTMDTEAICSMDVPEIVAQTAANDDDHDDDDDGHDDGQDGDGHTGAVRAQPLRGDATRSDSHAGE